MASSFEVDREESIDAGLGHVDTDEPPAQRKHVRIIVPTGKLGRKRIVDARAAALGFTVDRDRNPDPRAADGHPAFGVARCDRLGELASKLRIIDTFRTVCPEVRDVVTLLAQPACKLVLEGVAGMVGGEGDAQGD